MIKQSIVGEQFGKLQVISFAGKNNYRNWWNCKCDCGNVKTVREDRLINGLTSSCGCLLHKQSKTRLDLRNKKFGELTVISFDCTKQGKAYWKCCCSCGNVVSVCGKLLKSGKVKSCGCLKHRPNVNRKDISKERFGKLTVLCYSHTMNGVAYWKCLCDCGNETIVSRNNLVSNVTKSCGCLVHKPSERRLSLVGHKFGKLTVESFAGIKSNHSFWNCLCECGNKRIVNSDRLIQGDTVSCEKCSNISHISFGEKSVYDFIKSVYDGTVIENDRELIAPKELDIYVPGKKFAVEYDGLYWHSEAVRKDINYHKDKTFSCLEKGVRLFHIYENEWRDKKEICKSMIASALGIYERKEYARKCIVKPVRDKHTVINFFNTNHIQGAVNKYELALGLYKGEELLQVCVFGKQFFGRNEDIELYRMATKLNTQVLGGFSKIMESCPWDTVVSYVALRMFDGRGYLAGKWKIEHIAKPSFSVTDGINVYSRHLFKKSECLKKFSNVTEDMTEREMQVKNGYYRIWDSGTYKVRWTR